MREPHCIRLSNLLYGHLGKYTQHFWKAYDALLAAAEPISLGELACGCWIVLDGNNRTGLLLFKNPHATVADYPPKALIVLRKGRWDEEDMKWWNPAPETFAEVIRRSKHKKKRASEVKTAGPTYYGVIERMSVNAFSGVITSTLRDGGPITVVGRSPAEIDRRLRASLRRRFTELGRIGAATITIKLAGLVEASYVHVCGVGSTGN